MLLQQHPMEALDEAVALGTSALRRPMLDLLELQEQFAGVIVRPTAELAAVVTEDRGDARCS